MHLVHWVFAVLWGQHHQLWFMDAEAEVLLFILGLPNPSIFCSYQETLECSRHWTIVPIPSYLPFEQKSYAVTCFANSPPPFFFLGGCKICLRAKASRRQRLYIVRGVLSRPACHSTQWVCVALARQGALLERCSSVSQGVLCVMRDTDNQVIATPGRGC